MNTTLTIISIGGYVLAGVFAFIGIFNKQRQDREKLDDQTASNLIQNLKTTVDIQKTEIAGLTEDKIEQGKTIAHLEGQVKVLTDMVALRDPETMKAIAMIPDLHLIGERNGETLKKLTDAMTDFMTKFTASLPASGTVKTTVTTESVPAPGPIAQPTA